MMYNGQRSDNPPKAHTSSPKLEVGIPNVSAAAYKAATQTTLTSVDPGPLDFSGQRTKAVIVASQPIGMAIHTVHFNGLASALASGDPLDATYAWSYGDAGSPFNATTGWIGAHTYQNQGVYTATLTVTDKAGNTFTATVQVTIAADTRRMIYVDSVSGNDSNIGLTPHSAIATFARAGQLMGDNTELLFRNGQSFPVTDGMSISYKNVVIGSYGEGTTARLIKGVAPGSSIFNVSAASNGVVVQNLVFDSIWPVAASAGGRINARAFYLAGTNFTCRDSTFLSLEDGINSGGIARRVLIQGNYFSTQIRAYGIWGEGYDHVYVGNTMTASNQEHLIRCSGTGVTRLVIEDNNLSRNTGNKGSLDLRAASFFCVAGNTITNGSLGVGPLGPSTQAWTGWGAAQGNQINNVLVNIRPGVQHVAIHDNVINSNGATVSSVETQRNGPNSLVSGRVDADIRIFQNTILDYSTNAKPLPLDAPGFDIALENNVTVAPSNEQYSDVALQSDFYDLTVNDATAGASSTIYNPAASILAAKAPTAQFASVA